MTDIESIKARLRCDADTADMTQSLAQVLPKDIRALLDRVGELERKLAEAEREIRKLKGELESSINAEESERKIAINHARQTDAANERVKALEEALGSLIRTCKAVLGLNGGYRQSSGVLRSAVERAALAAKEDGDAS